MDASASFIEYLERSPLPIAVTEGRGHVLHSTNVAFRRLTGTSDTPPAGQPLTGVIPQEGRERVLALLDRVYRTGEAQSDIAIAHSRARDDGATWWSYTVWPVALDGRGRANGLVVQVSDATRSHQDRSDRQAASEQMRDVNERLLIASLHEEELATLANAAEQRAVFLADASAVLASSLDLQVTLESLARLTVPFLADWCIVHLAVEGGDARQMVVAHSDPRKEELSRELEQRFPLQPIVRGVLEHGKSMLLPTIPAVEPDANNTEYRQLRSELTARSGLSVPINVQEQVVGVITLLISQSDRRYGEDDVALAQALARHAALAIVSARRMSEVEAASQAKSRFLATMSHELRTPLTAIMGYEELLAEGITGPVTDAQRHQLARIKLSAVHLLGLIDEVLTVARVEAGREVVQYEPVGIDQLLESVAALVEPLAAQKQLAFSVRGVERPLTIETDAARVRQILVNLIGNAIKFTDQGDVTLCTHADGDTVAFVVRDTGIGISAENMEHIFEPFWQVEQRTTRRAGGTGLGLSVSRHLALLLGGALTVESSAGEGTTFMLTLPIAAPGGGQKLGDRRARRKTGLRSSSE